MANLITSEGRVRYGFYEEPVDNINYTDYPLETPFGIKIPGLLRKVLANQFHFTGVIGPEVMVGMAVVDLKYLANGFLYVYDRKTKTLTEIVEIARKIDAADREWIRQGIEMNQNLAYFGLDCGPVGCGYLNLMSRGIIPKCLISRAKSMIAAAVDARMDSYPLPAMSSGGSGNQGNLAILGPYLAGAEWGIEIARIEEAIAISHLVGSYLKCHVGNLSPMCGCAVTAGAGAAAAIAYLRNDDVDTIYKAIINFVGSCAGIICDGANGGCAMKVSNAAGAAIEAAMLAMEGFSINPNEGIRDPDIGRLAENLGEVGKRGMKHLDNVILEILSQKQPPKSNHRDNESAF